MLVGQRMRVINNSIFIYRARQAAPSFDGARDGRITLCAERFIFVLNATEILTQR